MALAAALTVLMALLPAGAASKSSSTPLKVTCEADGCSPKQTDVTTANAVLTVECPTLWEIDPPFDEREPKVFKTDKCENAVPLTDYSEDAKVNDSKPGMTITFGRLPDISKTFYLRCKEDDKPAKCDVKVILKPATTTPGPGGVPAPPPESGAPSVQICKQQNASITLKIPEEGSSAQFACESDFVLYPKEANKLFSKDCKKEETLSDMTRTQTTAAGTETDSRSEESSTYTYTLKADKKPSKKTLCYLCAKKGTTAAQPGTAANYCTIYVESGARTQLNLNFTFILALPCVLAAL